MNFKKLFFYGAVSVFTLLSAQASGSDALLWDETNDRTMVYKDGSLGDVPQANLSGILRRQFGLSLRESNRVINAKTNADRLQILKENREVFKGKAGVSDRFFRIVNPGPAIAPKRPTGGAPTRAEERDYIRKADLRHMFDNVDEDDEDLQANDQARRDRAARSIQSAWREKQERAQMERDLTATTDAYRTRARKAMESYNRFGPKDQEIERDMDAYYDAKREWMHDHRHDAGGGKDKMKKMWRELSKMYPEEVALDKKGHK